MNNLKTVYVAIEDESQPLIRDISMFADSVIDLQTTGSIRKGKDRRIAEPQA